MEGTARVEHTSRRLAKFLGFNERAFLLRPFRRHFEWGEDIEPRAAKWLAKLSAPSQSVRFQVDLEHLAIETDLFIEDSAMLDNCLKLQARVHDLAKVYPAAEAICNGMHKISIAVGILSDILKNAANGGVPEVLLPLTIEASAKLRAEWNSLSKYPADGCVVFYFKDGVWTSVGCLPLPQVEQIHGLLRQIEAVGYSDFRPYLSDSATLPATVLIQWNPSEVARLILS